ncbi:MAG: hypothetical protein IKR25_04195 [Muribaculaceae bacterium]|nr:hypothetical protein [Muribaculaceae bacterium]
MNNARTIYALLLAVLLAGSVSCKKDKESNDSYVYTTSTSSTLVSSFALQANSDVMDGLDSVFFTIDPERNVIYNADSLPVGTNISSLKVTMGFRSTVSKALFRVQDANRVITEYEYKSTSSDTLDFRYGVTLTITSADGLAVKVYDVKVNVHQVEPDSLVWPLSARRNLPGAADDNYALGTAAFNGQYWCLLHNKTGYAMSHAATPMEPWTTTTLGSGFTPQPATLAATSTALWVLDDAGQLLTSSDGVAWAAVSGVKWANLIGNYENRLLGLVAGADGTLQYDEYPRRDGYTPMPIDASFPVKGFSQLLTTTGAWAVAPQAVLVGGLKADGKPSNLAWAYDGEHWAVISSSSSALPALEAPTLISYFTHTINTANLKVSRRESWLVMGGRLKDGTISTDTYVSNNHGITWARGASSLKQSPVMPPFYGARAIVYNQPMAQGAVHWECPYIYIFGGYDSQGKLLNNIWQGVLPRMTFKPLK